MIYIRANSNILNTFPRNATASSQNEAKPAKHFQRIFYYFTQVVYLFIYLGKLNGYKKIHRFEFVPYFYASEIDIIKFNLILHDNNKIYVI